MRQLLLSLTLLPLAACPGQPPEQTGNDVDAGVDAAEPDAPPVTDGQRVSGKAMDYFVANTPLADAMVATDGIDPPKMATSGMDGAYALEAVPTGSKLFVTVTRTNYRPTRNVAITVADMPVEQDVYVMSIADINRQYATDGKTPTAGRAFLAAEMTDAQGQPLVGIPLANVVLHDMNNQPVPGIVGPYFFGAQGDIDPALLTSAAFAGKSRVAILDVPPGTFQLKVTYPDGVGGTITSIAQITSSADGAVLAHTGGMVPGTPATDPLFSTDIYPRLQTAANGGLGCANCHTTGGAGAVLIMDAPAATTLTNLTGRPGVINLLAPAESLLLTKPLYEPPPALQNHPNATFVDVNDPDYKLFLLWITNGAKP
jgi:hypothetical protein